MSEAGRSAWAGETPSWTQACATLYGGVVALMIGGVQPLVFGALVDAGRIGLADLGRIATLESLGLAAGATLGSFALRWLSTRALCFLAGALIALGNFAMPAARSLLALGGLRLGIGIAEGGLLSLTIVLISRAPAPERWSGGFLGVQTLTQGAGAWAVPALLTPRFGASGGFFLLSGMAALACVAAPFTAREHAQLAAASDVPRGRVPSVAWIALAFVVASLASTSAVWSYSERLGDARGLAPAFIGAAAAANLVSQAAGSFVATLIGPRLRWLAACGLATLAELGAIAALHGVPGAWPYALAGGVFGFFWLFGMPYQVRALVELDPTRSSARLIASAQILGSSFGPLAASALVRGYGLGGVLGFGAAASVAAFGLAASAFAAQKLKSA